MSCFYDGVSGRVFGEGIFENQATSRAVHHLNDLAGLDALETTEEQASDAVIYSLYAPACATPAAVDRVRKHLDSGVLHKLAKKMVANYFNPLSVDDYTAHGFVPVILGACAMSHGCSTLLDAPGYHMFFSTYHEFLRGIFETAPMMDGAKVQMKKALNGADAFKSGKLIDFATFTRSETRENAKPFVNKLSVMFGGMPSSYKPRYKSEQLMISMIAPCSKGDMEYDDDNMKCGGCNKKLKKGMMCAKCKDQRYCSKECQRKDFGRHKVVCRKPEDREDMFGRNLPKWMNQYYLINGMGGMGGLSGLMGGMGGMGGMMGGAGGMAGLGQAFGGMAMGL